MQDRRLRRCSAGPRRGGDEPQLVAGRQADRLLGSSRGLVCELQAVAGFPWRGCRAVPGGDRVRLRHDLVSRRREDSAWPREDGRSRIRILHLKTGELESIAGSERLFSPRWSPDEKRILAMELNTGKLHILDSATGEWRPLADAAHRVSQVVPRREVHLRRCGPNFCDRGCPDRSSYRTPRGDCAHGFQADRGPDQALGWAGQRTGSH